MLEFSRLLVGFVHGSTIWETSVHQREPKWVMGEVMGHWLWLILCHGWFFLGNRKETPEDHQRLVGDAAAIGVEGHQRHFLSRWARREDPRACFKDVCAAC